MRKPMTMVLFASGIMFVSAMAEAKIKFERFHREITIEVPTIKEISVIKPKLEAKVKMPVVKNHSTFLDAIGFRESSNNYKAVNQFGYLGKYQFGRKTLNAIGFENISNREFLANPSIQEEAMLVLLKRNKHTLRREIKKYVGKTINGIYITESGILAAAHLGGAGNVKKFFRKGYEFKDGNGTKMTSYMKRFANYQLNI
jgi:hypothetical protein